jgi:hypothetical protein
VQTSEDKASRRTYAEAEIADLRAKFGQPLLEHDEQEKHLQTKIAALEHQLEKQDDEHRATVDTAKKQQHQIDLTAQQKR